MSNPAIRAVPDLPREPEEIERAFVGGLLLRPDLVGEARRIVKPGDVYRGPLATVFLAILDVADSGSEPDLLSVVRHLRDAGELDRVGGAAAVAALSDGVPKSDFALSYARLIASAARRRRAVVAASGLVGALADRDGESTVRALLEEIAGEIAPRDVAPVDLHSDAVTAARPAFAVSNLIRRAGLHLVWSEPSGGKTWTLLRIAHELLSEPHPSRLLGHPDLWINSGWRRVLWIATEEDAPTLRHKADWIVRGLDNPTLAGTLLYLFAPGPGRRITLDDLPDLLARYGPLDAVILDSLTGLRPKRVDGERVRWDLDNDAANEQCLRLRALAVEHQTAVLLVHHTGRDTTKGYRGPTDWWASADVMFGLVPDGGRTKVIVEKNRDGRRLAPFYLEPTWSEDRYSVEYVGGACPARLSPTAERLRVFYSGRGMASQTEAIRAVGVSRSHGLEAIRQLVAAGLLRDTGNVAARSPIYADCGSEVSGVSGEVSDVES